MRISPVLLARLLAYSFLSGGVLAVVNAFFRSFNVLIDGKSLCKNSRLEQALASRRAPFVNKPKKQLASDGSTEKNEKNSARRSLPDLLKRVYNFAVDLALPIAAGGAIVLLCYYLNYGEMRGFCVLGLLGGFWLFHFCIGKALARTLGEVNLIVRFLMIFLARIILAPLTTFLNFCKKLLKFFKIKISNALEKRKKVLYNNNELLYIYKLSEKSDDILDGKEAENNGLIMSKEQKNGTYEKSR